MVQLRLPEELIIETLLCLPVKSVLRFRCLSKPLYSVIDSPNFINSHLSKSSQNPNLRKLIIQSINNFNVCDLNFDLEDDNTIRLTKTFSYLRNEVYGYCNGLLLLSRSSVTSMCYNGLELSLWNPSTRHYMDLPDCPGELRSIATINNIFGSGLGYDHSTDEYKAFFIVPAERKDEFGFEFDVEVWIYEFKLNIWRRAQNFPYPLDRVVMSPGFDGLGYYADGNVYCLCKVYRGKWKLEIVEFDVRKETFSLVPRPDCTINSGGMSVSMKLHVLEGCLYISYLSNSVPRHSELYIRKNDELGRYTWTLLFCVSDPLFYNIMTVLRYSKRGDKILLYNSVEYLVSYDVKEKSFGRVEVDVDCRWNDPILCLESLVPLGGRA